MAKYDLTNAEIDAPGYRFYCIGFCGGRAPLPFSFCAWCYAKLHMRKERRQPIPKRDDKKRMDWLEGQCSGTYTGTIWEVTGEGHQDIRAAIDKAMKAEEEQDAKE